MPLIYRSRPKDDDQEMGIRRAILESKNHSCGKGLVYDGTFTGKMIEGNGVTVQLLIDNGIEVMTDE